MFGGAFANIDEFGGGEGCEFRARGRLISQIAPDQSVVRLNNFDEQLARLVMRHARDVEALVSLTVTKNRHMKHKDFSNLRFKPLSLMVGKGDCPRSALRPVKAP